MRNINFSVLISVYKNELPKNLRESIKSIYDEQHYKPEEIILIVDGPIGDELSKCISSLVKTTPAINVFYLEENMGLASALNFGLKKCSGTYVARMDSDDISAPNRFYKQFHYLETNPEIGVLGGGIEEFNEDTGEKITVSYPLLNEDILKGMSYRNSMAHVTTVFRREVLISHNYDESKKNEDYDLWFRLYLSGIKFANLPDSLVKVRTNSLFFNRRKDIKRALEVAKTKCKFTKVFKLGFHGYIYSILHFFLFMSPGFVKKFIYKNFRT